MSIILEMFKLDRPPLNDWVEFKQRSVSGKKEDRTDEKYDVFGDHWAGGVKWRYRQRLWTISYISVRRAIALRFSSDCKLMLLIRSAKSYNAKTCLLA